MLKLMKIHYPDILVKFEEMVLNNQVYELKIQYVKVVYKLNHLKEGN